jgi:hypothetical protein
MQFCIGPPRPFTAPKKYVEVVTIRVFCALRLRIDWADENRHPPLRRSSNNAAADFFY